MPIRARIFATLIGARNARDTLDPTGVKRWLLNHDEGDGRLGYRIANPGNAAARLRARGIRSRVRIIIIRHPDGGSFALPEPDGETLAGAVTLPAQWRDAQVADGSFTDLPADDPPISPRT